MQSQNGYRTVHVEGRTPGALGRDQMVAVQDGIEDDIGFDGSHHLAVYLAAIRALAEAVANREAGLVVTSSSEHLVKQMRGVWKVGSELNDAHATLKILEKGIPGGVTWDHRAKSIT